MPPLAPPTAPIGKAPGSSPSPISADRAPHRRGLGAAFGFALAGFAAAWSTERNLRIHVALGALAATAAIVLRLSALAGALIALTIGAVIAAELMNSAIEAAVDLAGPDPHPLAKRAKDTAAAAVLVTALAACAVGVLVLAGRVV